MNETIRIKGANEHNLRNVDLTIPRDKLVVFTGLSGSGKSSLAFDTIYAEGQRRYMESLSSYARQFLGQMDKPDVEQIDGLSPAISIDQKTTSKNPRSTVGTVTEIHDYLRLLYARIGIPHCPVCGREITSQSVDQIVDQLKALPEGTRLTLLAPVIRERKGTHDKILERIRKEGFVRVRVDGEIRNLSEETVTLEKNFKHTIEIVADRIVVKPGIESRLAESVELCIRNGEGLVKAYVQPAAAEPYEQTFSTKLACPDHGASLEELEPRMFSFNSPFGACPKCSGLGFTQHIDPEAIVDPELTLMEGALANVFGNLKNTNYLRALLTQLAKEHGSDLNTPWKDLPPRFQKELLFGTDGRVVVFPYVSKYTGSRSMQRWAFEGAVENLERRMRETNSEFIQDKIREYLVTAPCPVCHGKRLKPEVLAVTVGGKNIAEFSDMAVRDALAFLNGLELSERHRTIGIQILKEIRARLQFLTDVGLDYLTLSRAAGSLSGGEAQRIRLATQIGSGLMGVLYILDEPS
ncbi:MAG: excinuclease ABC subunit UvrA, partial [Firmicutes bacterium]|nr:excinuclease ABC subunit UvrA [Bacillota bacterium]